MTATELTKRFPEASKGLYERGFKAGFTAGQQIEREAWQKRIISEERAGEIVDEITREVFNI